MELRHLRYFAAVARKKSFSKAALELHVSQPALSRQIRDLEHELGTQLFNRSDRGVELTDTGNLLLEGALGIIADLEALTARVRERAKGTPPLLRLAHFGTFSALLLAPFLQRLRKRHPKLRVVLRELLPRDAFAELKRGQIDACLAGLPAPEMLAGLCHRMVFRDQPVAVVPADHRLAKKRRLALADAANESWAVWDESMFPGFGDSFITACRKSGYEPAIVATVHDVPSVIEQVGAGEFLAYVGSAVAQSRMPGVAFVPFREGEIDMPTILAWRADSPHATALEWLAGLMDDSPRAAAAVPSRAT